MNKKRFQIKHKLVAGGFTLMLGLGLMPVANSFAAEVGGSHVSQAAPTLQTTLEGENDAEILVLGDDEDFADPHQVAADAIGISLDALFDATDNGQSIADVARANGVEPQAVIEALTAADSQWIDEMEAAGDISAEEAASWRADLNNWNSYMVNEVYVDPYKLAARTIGISEDAMWEALDGGQTLSDVAVANGVDAQTVIDALVAADNAEIDQLEMDGMVSAEEAAEWRAETVEYVTEMVNESWEMFGGEFVDPYETAAEAIGIEVDALWEALDSGQSLADVAVANGVDAQTLIDAMVAVENTWVDEMEVAGDISAEEAAEWRAETVEYVTEMVNESWEAFDDDFADFDFVDPYEAAATAIGIDIDALYEATDNGQSIADVATANGVDPQAVVDAMTAADSQWIDEMEVAGEISAEEAAEWREELSSWNAVMVNEVYVDPFMVAADTIGTDEDTMWEALDSGQSLADLAEANGVDPQAVVDALVTSEREQIDQLEADGLISAEEADAWRAEVESEITDLINENWDEMYEDSSAEDDASIVTDGE